MKQKKIIKRFSHLFIFLSLFFSILGLSSCSNSNSIEDKVADIIIINIITHAKDPGSVVVASPIYEEKYKIVTCKIGWKNSYGSLNYDIYFLVVEDVTLSDDTKVEEGYYCTFDDATRKAINVRYHSVNANTELSANKINEKLNKWKKDNGYTIS